MRGLVNDGTELTNTNERDPTEGRSPKGTRLVIVDDLGDDKVLGFRSRDRSKISTET